MRFEVDGMKYIVDMNTPISQLYGIRLIDKGVYPLSGIKVSGPVEVRSELAAQAVESHLGCAFPAPDSPLHLNTGDTLYLLWPGNAPMENPKVKVLEVA